MMLNELNSLKVERLKSIFFFLQSQKPGGSPRLLSLRLITINKNLHDAQQRTVDKQRKLLPTPSSLPSFLPWKRTAAQM